MKRRSRKREKKNPQAARKEFCRNSLALMILLIANNRDRSIKPKFHLLIFIPKGRPISNTIKRGMMKSVLPTKRVLYYNFWDLEKRRKTLSLLIRKNQIILLSQDLQKLPNLRKRQRQA
jgi:hypothetical protein